MWLFAQTCLAMRLTRKMIIFISSMVLLSTGSFYFYQILNAPNILNTRKGKVKRQAFYLYIDRNTNFAALLDSLQHYNALDDKLSFAFLAKIVGYQENIRTGRYLVEPDMSNLQLLRLLRGGQQVPVKLIIPALRPPHQILPWLESRLMLQADELEQVATNYTDSLKQYGLNMDLWWCIFIPNTYEVYWDISAKGLIRRMLLEFERFWTPDRLQKAAELQLKPAQVMALASIVQAETNKIDEMPRIAGVYLNRLRRNMYLQADPTVIFAVGDYSIRRVTASHLAIDSPYNTYKYKGLPPGPIALPMPHAIDAVLNYEKHEYYYFCAREDFSGYHTFAHTFEEHKRNARRYQQALQKRLQQVSNP